MSPRFFSPATLLIWCSHPAQVLQTLPPLPGCQHVPVVFSYLAVESECSARGKFLNICGIRETTRVWMRSWQMLIGSQCLVTGVRTVECGGMLQFVLWHYIETGSTVCSSHRATCSQMADVSSSGVVTKQSGSVGWVPRPLKPDPTDTIPPSSLVEF